MAAVAAQAMGYPLPRVCHPRNTSVAHHKKKTHCAQVQAPDLFEFRVTSLGRVHHVLGLVVREEAKASEEMTFCITAMRANSV